MEDMCIHCLTDAEMVLGEIFPGLSSPSSFNLSCQLCARLGVPGLNKGGHQKRVLAESPKSLLNLNSERGWREWGGGSRGTNSASDKPQQQRRRSQLTLRAAELRAWSVKLRLNYDGLTDSTDFKFKCY